MMEPGTTYVALDGIRRPVRNDGPPPCEYDLTLDGRIAAGHGVASGRAPDSPFPTGTIQIQYPFFKALGLDLGRCYPGTLNVSIAPRRYRITNPLATFEAVAWHERWVPENFHFASCYVATDHHALSGFIYQPDPATKVAHFDDPSHLQIIAPYLPNEGYGTSITVFARSSELAVT